MNDRGTPTVAFALGGLAGNNAHGPGSSRRPWMRGSSP